MVSRPLQVPLPPIARPRLTDRLASARVGIVIAGAGYGTSVLADQLAAHLGVPSVAVDLPVGADPLSMLGALRRGLRAAGATGLADALEPAEADLAGDDQAIALVLGERLHDAFGAREEPMLVVARDVQRLGDHAGIVAALASAVPPPHRVLLVGRSIPEPILEGIPDAVRLGPGDLAFTPAEILELARTAGVTLDPAAADRLYTATAGWPAAVELALRAPRPESDVPAADLGGLLRRLLDDLGPAQRASVETLAELPLLSGPVASTAAGPDALEHLRSSGLPIRVRADGWLEIPAPVRDALGRSVTLSAAVARAVAGAYFSEGQPRAAISYLDGRADPEGIGALLADRPWQELQALEPAELRAVLSTLPGPVVDARPELLLSMARVAGAAVHIRWREEVLARAASTPAVLRDPALGRQVDAERAEDAARDGDAQSAITLARSVLRDAGPAERRTRAQALVAIGRARAFEREPTAMAEAAEALTEAAALLRGTSEPELLRQALQVLGYEVHFAMGDLDAAIDALQAAADLSPLGARTRAGILTFLADAFLYAGRLEDAEVVLRQVLDTARRLRDQRLLGYHAWMQAGVASRRGDGAATAAWLDEAERHPGDWFAHPTGIELLADGVDHLGRTGDHTEAARYLARVEARCAADGRPGVDQIALVARAIHGARAGDPVAAEADLVAAIASDQLPPRETWRMHLLRALAAHRRGDPAAAATLLERARHGAEALGHPELPRIHEALTLTLVAPPAAARDAEREAAATRAVIGASAADPGEPDGPRLYLRVLGGFAVTADGRPADPPVGRPATLVKLLAVTGGPIAAEDAVETLWPEVDPDVGRTRLRNVLARIRTASGDLVRREGDALVLAPGVAVDLEAFEADARAALDGPQNGAVDREAIARRAVARYAGEVLPADRYEDFAAVPRERARLRHLALVSMLADRARARGDIDEALRYLEEGIAAEPLDDGRYEAAAALAFAHGRRDRARRLLERGMAVVADLGVDPSPSMTELERTLGLDGPEAHRGRSPRAGGTFVSRSAATMRPWS